MTTKSDSVSSPLVVDAIILPDTESHIDHERITQFLVKHEGARVVTLTKVVAEWEGDMAVIRIDPGGEYDLWIDKEDGVQE